jgi:muconate cycloisomerase
VKITRIETIGISVPYPGDYRVASGTMRNSESVILKLYTDEGLVGLGEATFALIDRTGESVEAITAALSKYLGPRLIGENPFNIETIMAKLEHGFYGGFAFPYSKTAIDNALYDIMGKALGVPVHMLLGGLYRDSYTIGRSIPNEAPEKMAERAQELKDAGYRSVTLKAGFGAGGDLQRLAAIRRAVGDDFPIDVDANQGYSANTGISTLRRMESYGITGIEQPVPWWDLDGLEELTRALDTPVIAHESVLTVADCANIAKRRAADVICLTLARNAGFYWVKKMAAIAEASNIPCTLGSMHPLGVQTAAIAHLVASTRTIMEPIGYGSPLERLGDDVVTEPLTVRNGVVTVPTKPGLGVELDEDKVKKYSAGIFTQS